MGPLDVAGQDFREIMRNLEKGLMLADLILSAFAICINSHVSAMLVRGHPFSGFSAVRIVQVHFDHFA